jgi:hypothetical protein
MSFVGVNLSAAPSVQIRLGLVGQVCFLWKYCRSSPLVFSDSSHAERDFVDHEVDFTSVATVSSCAWPSPTRDPMLTNAAGPRAVYEHAESVRDDNRRVFAGDLYE